MRNVSILLTALLLSVSAWAQEKNADVDKIFAWATPTTPGCAVAASLNGKVVVNRAYGLADLERDVPIRPDSVFDAGSLQKQFVAAAALLLVEDGRIALTDDVRKHIPELPDYGKTITVDHLLTHTSGLRDWIGLQMLSASNDDAMKMILRQRGLNFAPGDEWAYSNSGFVLLKEIVARKSGMSFDDFTRKRLFEPLGMKATAYRTDLRAVVKNRALAYDKAGDRWRLAVLLDNERGGGGALLTTASDLLIWNDALTHSRLGAKVTEKLHEPARLNNGRKLDYTRGLIIDTYRGTKEVWHSGSADGYKAWLGRYPEHGLSIAIMCNSGDDTDRDAFAHRIFDLFVPNAAAQRDPAPPAVTVDLSSRTGIFINERTGEPLRLVMDGNRFRIAGGPALTPVTADRFKRFGAALMFMSQDEFELNFVSNDQFELKTMEGQTTRYRRAVPHSPAAADLQSLAGRYGSEEMNAVFELVPNQDGFVLRLEHLPARTLDFKPVDRDTFQRGAMLVRLVRDSGGKVVALDYTNPMLRNIRFTRR